jgi:hypothetical protein
LHHGAAPADGCHLALVPVAELSAPAALEVGADDLGSVPALLDRHGRHARQRAIHVGSLEVGSIADHQDLRIARHAQIRAH